VAHGTTGAPRNTRRDTIPASGPGVSHARNADHTGYGGGRTGPDRHAGRDRVREAIVVRYVLVTTLTPVFGRHTWWPSSLSGARAEALSGEYAT
jgi:hypothetical protein